MMAMELNDPRNDKTYEADPRIDAIYKANPVLKLVGRGTILDVLDAAATAGLIPESRTETIYGIDYTHRGGSVHTVRSLEYAHDLNASGSDKGGIRGPVVFCTRTTFESIDTSWAPVPVLEDQHV